MLKSKIYTIICAIMVFMPWTILPLRTFDWALKSPIAQIMITSYAIFMIFSGLFTIYSYVKIKNQNNLIKICLVINNLYAIVGIAVLLGMFLN